VRRIWSELPEKGIAEDSTKVWPYGSEMRNSEDEILQRGREMRNSESEIPERGSEIRRFERVSETKCDDTENDPEDDGEGRERSASKTRDSDVPNATESLRHQSVLPECQWGMRGPGANAHSRTAL
jgi:hypothetical protein